MIELTREELLMILEYQRFSWSDRGNYGKEIFEEEKELREKLNSELKLIEKSDVE